MIITVKLTQMEADMLVHALAAHLNTLRAVGVAPTPLLIDAVEAVNASLHNAEHEAMLAKTRLAEGRASGAFSAPVDGGLNPSYRPSRDAAEAYASDVQDAEKKLAGMLTEMMSHSFAAPPLLPVSDEELLADANGISLTALWLFIDYASDAPNWSGQPLVGGNVNQGPRENGYLTALKKAGLLITEVPEADGHAFVIFTDKGRALASDLKINLGG